MTNLLRDTLEIGKTYDAEATCQRFAGWAKEGSDLGNHLHGYSVYHYFSAEGKYLGPDTEGIEPMFAPPAERNHVYVTIERKEDGKIVQIHRDVCTTHPEWVHVQMGTSSESELQAALDCANASDYEDKGRDCDGVMIEMLTTDELVSRSKAA